MFVLYPSRQPPTRSVHCQRTNDDINQFEDSKFVEKIEKFLSKYN